jgi:sodium/hydrogen exchanger-like protein 6/7
VLHPVRPLQDTESTLFLGIAVCLSILCVGILINYLLRALSVPPTACPDSFVFVLLGACVALALEFGSPQRLRQVVDAIDDSYAASFVGVLLPPIILHSGFELNAKAFFQRIYSTCTFAFLGTAISAASVGLLIWALSQIPGLPAFSLLDALLFGTLLSATDRRVPAAARARRRARPRVW